MAKYWFLYVGFTAIILLFIMVMANYWFVPIKKNMEGIGDNVSIAMGINGSARYDNITNATKNVYTVEDNGDYETFLGGAFVLLCAVFLYVTNREKKEKERVIIRRTVAHEQQ